MRAGDDDLINAAVAGNRDAFAELVRRHRGWVQGFLRAYIQNEAQAEDLTQEVFCRVYARMSGYAGQGVFAAWVKRIATNLAKDHLRANKRAPGVPLEALKDTPSEATFFDPAAVLASRLLHEEVREAIATLPADQKQAVLLYYFGEQSLEQIAHTTGSSTGTIKSRLFHARRRIRAVLTAQSPVK